MSKYLASRHLENHMQRRLEVTEGFAASSQVTGISRAQGFDWVSIGILSVLPDTGNAPGSVQSVPSDVLGAPFSLVEPWLLGNYSEGVHFPIRRCHAAADVLRCSFGNGAQSPRYLIDDARQRYERSTIELWIAANAPEPEGFS